ncbi:uncharacterized protein LOC111712916 isoform X2 [Eurytemora carolleeae]|uniref:uncharacterized protein LOC111712916 isoform X2 n=1 Tax=Eurytemora carolleeae TaxID=1294199 RepID=UPI000C7651DD|nr:uncharacterized protein LOC111712916 isoform X2 [Eurytemora carolleeae]|eukprot:XP_023343442.1 uncharacterized protein LOC111712916 isoform X2 [Eurytemora affinis]
MLSLINRAVHMCVHVFMYISCFQIPILVQGGETCSQEPKEGITKIFQDISTWVQDLIPSMLPYCGPKLECTALMCCNDTDEIIRKCVLEYWTGPTVLYVL